MPSEAAGWIAVGGVVGGAIGGLVAAAIRFLNARETIRKARQLETIGEWQRLANDRREENERQAAVIRQLQAAVEALWRSESNCRQKLAGCEACGHFLHDRLRDVYRVLREMGRDPGELPDLPEFTVHDAPGADFLARQAQQSAVLVTEAAKTIPPAPPAATGGT